MIEHNDDIYPELNEYLETRELLKNAFEHKQYREISRLINSVARQFKDCMLIINADNKYWIASNILDICDDYFYLIRIDAICKSLHKKGINIDMLATMDILMKELQNGIRLIGKDHIDLTLENEDQRSTILKLSSEIEKKDQQCIRINC